VQKKKKIENGQKDLWWTHGRHTFTHWATLLYTCVCNNCSLYIVRNINAGFLSIQGDSGGPMVIRNSSRWVQSGIVSFGAQRCDDPRYPSVSTRVSQFQDWIKSYMGSNLPGFVASSGSRSSLNLLLFPFFLTFSVIPFTFSLYLSS